jgi:glycosyltransferase involved in cell wall biosynthesis
MREPTVSIVLPTYNGARYLAQSVESCLEQTCQDLELILVDDCSTDATPQIIAQFVARDARVRTVRHELNRRLPGAINTGVGMSRGRFLTWTSDDNLYRPQAIAEMAAALDADASLGMVYARATLIDAQGKPSGPAFSGPVDMLAHTNPIGACFMYRREVYEKIGGYAEDLFLVEDWDYWLRIAETFPIRYLDSDLYLYREHEGSLTSQKEERVKRAIRELLERHLPRMHWASRVARCRGFSMAARIAWRFGDRRQAWRLFRRAVAEAPAYALTKPIRVPIKRLRKKFGPDDASESTGATTALGRK